MLSAILIHLRTFPAFRIILFATSLLLACATFSAEEEEPKLPILFILHSYEEDDICGQPQEAGALAALAAEGCLPGRDFQLRTYWLNTRKKNTTQEQLNVAARAAREEIDRVQPQVLLVFDDNAFKSVGLQYADRPGISVVYCGINGQLDDYNKIQRFYETPQKPGHNITGVYETLHVADAFKVQRELMPQTKQILVITDNAHNEQALTHQIDKELKGLSGWEKKIANTWEEYTALIQAANDDPTVGALYPVALQLTDAANKQYSTLDILRWTAQNSRKPELAFNHAFCKFGFFGGAVVDFTAMGGQAGRLVAQILKGKAAKELPLENAERFTLVFNLNKMKKLGIAIPEDILLAAEELYK